MTVGGMRARGARGRASSPSQTHRRFIKTQLVLLVSGMRGPFLLFLSTTAGLCGCFPFLLLVSSLSAAESSIFWRSLCPLLIYRLPTSFLVSPCLAIITDGREDSRKSSSGEDATSARLRSRKDASSSYASVKEAS